MSFIVVFEGSLSGVYDSCRQCVEAIAGVPGKMFERYDSYDAAVRAWETHCEVNGYDQDKFQAGLYQAEVIHSYHDGMSGSNVENPTIKTSHIGQASSSHLADSMMLNENQLVEPQHITESTDWIVKYNMQLQLVVMCDYLGIQHAVYTRDHLRVRQGIPYFRFKVTIVFPAVLREPLQCYGKRSKTEDDAKEDSAFVALRWLLKLTALKVRDFNYYNAREMEQKLKVLEIENKNLRALNVMLQEQLDVQQNDRTGPN